MFSYLFSLIQEYVYECISFKQIIFVVVTLLVNKLMLFSYNDIYALGSALSRRLTGMFLAFVSQCCPTKDKRSF